MAKKSLEPLTEPMFYVLMCLFRENMYGTEITNYVQELTEKRISLGPGTLYSILSVFQSEKLIEKCNSDGRRIVYAITDKGRQIYQNELSRLKKCIEDSNKVP